MVALPLKAWNFRFVRISRGGAIFTLRVPLALKSTSNVTIKKARTGSICNREEEEEEEGGPTCATRNNKLQPPCHVA